MSDTHLLNDSITFSLRSEQVLLNDTVKVTVNVAALATPDTSEEKLRANIKEALKAFIDTEWRLRDVQRVADETGFEKVTLSASSRVPEAENHNVDDRAKAASRKGLMLSDPDVDASIPLEVLEKAAGGLRAEILSRAVAEAKTQSEILGRPLRVHAVRFNGVSSEEPSGVWRQASSRSPRVMASIGMDRDLSVSGTAASLESTGKVLLSAEVVLAYSELLA